MHVLTALLSGILFGIGLSVCGLINPAKVLAFLDIAGEWDPSLAVTMAAAVATTAIGYRVVLKRRTPLFAENFQLPAASSIDRRLVAGAAVFGVGWGLVGFCPGPAISSLSFGSEPVFIFVAAMLVGMASARIFARTRAFNPLKATTT
jgi:uncharacterized membrane protein YedE/YeeE